MHLNRNPSVALSTRSFFFHRGRSVTALNARVCPAGCANIRNRNMNIPCRGAASFAVPPLPPPLYVCAFSYPLRRALSRADSRPRSRHHPQQPPCTGPLVLSSLWHQPPFTGVHVCPSRVYLFTCVCESAIPILVPFLWRAVSAVIGKRRRGMRRK